MSIPLLMCHSVVWQGCLSDKFSTSKLFPNRGWKKTKRNKKRNREFKFYSILVTDPRIARDYFLW